MTRRIANHRPLGRRVVQSLDTNPSVSPTLQRQTPVQYTVQHRVMELEPSMDISQRTCSNMTDRAVSRGCDSF